MEKIKSLIYLNLNNNIKSYLTYNLLSNGLFINPQLLKKYFTNIDFLKKKLIIFLFPSYFLFKIN